MRFKTLLKTAAAALLCCFTASCASVPQQPNYNNYSSYNYPQPESSSEYSEPSNAPSETKPNSSVPNYGNMVPGRPKSTSQYVEPNVSDSDVTSKFDIKAGPILIRGSISNGFTAAQMNLSTGELEPVFSFYNSYSNKYFYTFAFDPTKSQYMSCYFTQQLFNEDLTKLAVGWRDSSDSSNHVGWVDRDGNLTDVTAKIHPHTTDFSTKVPHDNYALFSPDGYFVFTDCNNECYCFIDVDSMSVVKEVPYIVDDSSYYSKHWGYKAQQVIFMPNGDLKALWHTEDNSYAGYNIKDFGECYIQMPNSSKLKTWDYLYDNRILCTGHDDEGYFIAEIGEGIGEQSLLGFGDLSGNYCWNYAYHGDFTNRGRDGIEPLLITPHTDYRLESCVYSNNQIAFIGSRGNERYLFIVDDAENSNPTQIAPIDNSWQLLFWK